MIRKNNSRMKQMRFFEKIVLFVVVALTTSCDQLNEILGVDDILDDIKEVNIESGLMAYYTFDNGTAEDATDNCYDGTLINNPLFVTETIDGSGKAIFFNSQKDQYMSIPYNPFKEISNYTATMWVKDFSYGNFLKIGDNDDSFMFYYTEDGFFKFRLNSRYEYGTFDYDAKSLIDGRWHMLAIARIDNLCKLYVDGLLVASKEVNRYEISEYPSILIDNHMKFDNLRLYNRAINAKEVKEIYNKEK